MTSVHTRQSSSVAPTKSAAIPLYRRLLFPTLPAAAEVPLIIDGVSSSLNLELYDFLALALRGYVTPWWSHITRYDRALVPQIAQIIVHVVRVLHARFLKANLPDLILTQLPIILSQHYLDFRASQTRLGSAYAGGGASGLATIFHGMQAHVALDVDGRVDPEYVRHAVELILCTALPEQDSTSPAELAIVREVIVKILTKDVIPLLCQPWFLHKLLLDLLAPPNVITKASSETDSSSKDEQTQASPTRNAFSFHGTLVFVLSSVQYIAGVCLTLIHMYRSVLQTVRTVNTSTMHEEKKSVVDANEEMSKDLPQTALSSKAAPNLSISVSSPNAKSSSDPGAPRSYGPALLQLADDVFTLRSRTSTSALLDVFNLFNGYFSPFVDRYLLYTLRTTLLTERTTLTLLRSAKSTLFPNGYPGPPPIIPTLEEQVVLKDSLIRVLTGETKSLTPLTLLLGPSLAIRQSSATSTLEPLSSPACNAHLAIVILDTLILALFPELAAKTIVTQEVVASASGTSSIRYESSLLARDGERSPLSRTDSNNSQNTNAGDTRTGSNQPINPYSVMTDSMTTDSIKRS